MSTFAVRFLGCKVSQADMMLARGALLDTGHLEAREDQADLRLVTTCCITREAEAKSRQAVRRSLAGAQRVYVSGCAANLDPAQFASIDPRVQVLSGTAEDVAAALGAPASGPGEFGSCAVTAHDPLPSRSGAGSTAFASGAAQRTRGFVKVQDGCDGDCAYCIIPTVRGAARSRPASAVLAEVERRVARGQPEIVVTGISVGDYVDPERGIELGELMVAIAETPGVRRVRLSSVEVIHVRDSLIEALRREPKVCPHLHIPLQSGDDSVLADMGRHYDAAAYLRAIGALREAVPHVNVTTDVIVGFPTEDDAAFERTLELIDAAGITRVHAFTYSPRPGTPAAALGDRVPPAVKSERSRRLRGHAEARSRLHRTAKLGSAAVVLIDKVAGTACSGYTADYTRAYLPPGSGRRGELVQVRCLELHADGVRCAGISPHDRGEADRARVGAVG